MAAGMRFDQRMAMAGKCPVQDATDFGVVALCGCQRCRVRRQANT